MMYRKNHAAFTLLELIFVIVILGIVASISSQMIVQVYESYIMQKSIHNAGIKTELAINQLANRLTYRIDRSMQARNPTNGTALPAAEVPIADVNDYTALEWISYDSDSYEATAAPAWSGYADLAQSTFAALATPGSATGQLANYGHYGNSRAIVFAGDPRYRTDGNGPGNGTYQAACMYQPNGCIFKVAANGNGSLNFAANAARQTPNMEYTEFYRLAASAFAVVPTNPHTINTVNVWDLRLYYGYQPWDGDTYLQGQNSILLRNVSVFRFKKEVNSIRIKLCTVEPTAIGDQIALCKEKAVIR